MPGRLAYAVFVAGCVALPLTAAGAAWPAGMDGMTKPVGAAIRAAASQLHFGVGALRQDYVEFDRRSAVPTSWLDREGGMIPAIEAGASLLWPGNVYSTLQVSYAWGTTDYDGYKQPLGGGSALLPYTTTTGNDVLDTRASLGYVFSLTPWLSVAPQVEGGYSGWRREVHARAGVISVTENYTAYRYGLGAEAWLVATDRLVFNLRAGVARQHAEIDADALSASLGTNTRTRFAVGLDYRLSGRWHLGVSVSRAHYRYDRSTTAASGFFEPPSATTHWRFMTRVAWAWF